MLILVVLLGKGHIQGLQIDSESGVIWSVISSFLG